MKRVRAFQIELEFGSVGFEGKGKTGVPGEKSLGVRERTNNKLNPHIASTLGFEPGPHWWEASALTSAPPFPLKMLLIYEKRELLLSNTARNRGRVARVATAVFSYFGNKHGDLVYKEMYVAKIVFENRSSRQPVKFAALASTTRKYPKSNCMNLLSTQVR